MLYESGLAFLPLDIVGRVDGGLLELAEAHIFDERDWLVFLGFAVHYFTSGTVTSHRAQVMPSLAAD